MELRDTVRKATRKSNMTEATVLTFGGGFASVAIGGTGKVIHGIKVVGGAPVPGEKVDIDYSTDKPVVRSRAGSAGKTTIIYSGGGGPSGSASSVSSEAPPPQTDWFDQAGWSIDANGSIVSASGATTIFNNGQITLGTSNDVAIMSSADATYRIWVGNATAGSAPFSVTKAGALTATSAEIGGWNVNATTIYDDTSSIILNSSNATIQVGSGVNYILIDGANDLIRSSNFSSGSAGWRIQESGDAEFNNILARGSIYASIFEYGTIQSTAGTLAVTKSAAKLQKDFTTPAYLYTRTAGGYTSGVFDFEEDMGGNSRVSAYDVVHIKKFDSSGVKQAYMYVESITDMTGYRRAGVSMMYGDVSTTFEEGTGFLVYGRHGDGSIYLSADDIIGSSANMSIMTHSYGVINSLSIWADGSGYSVNDILTLTDGSGYGSGCTVKVLTRTGDNGVATFSIQTKGSGYGPGVHSTTGGTGTGAQFFVADMDGPWDTTDLKVRIGNMDGSYGTPTDRYGIGIGDFSGGNFLSYNAEVADSFVIKTGDGAITLDDDGITLGDPGELNNQYSVKWLATGGDLLMGISSYESGGTAWNQIRNETYGSRHTAVSIEANCNTGYTSKVTLGANYNFTTERAWLTVAAASSWNNIWFYADEVQVTNSNGHNANFTVLGNTSLKNTYVNGGLGIGSIGFVTTSGRVKATEAMFVGTGLTVGSTSSPTLTNGSIQAGGTIRSAGAYSNDYSGDGIEMYLSGSIGLILSYDRTGGHYLQTQIRGDPLVFYEGTSARITIDNADMYTVALTAYEGSSTVTGWSSFSYKKIEYKRVGRTMYVYFRLEGTSNSATTTFTLPYGCAVYGGVGFMFAGQNNGTWGNGSWGWLGNGSSTLYLYWYIPNGSWTASGNKICRGHFVYEI